MGRTGLKLSTISLGGWLTFGESIQDDDPAQQIVDCALDGGVNFIDLADGYANGAAEKMMGRLLAGKRRQDLVISSKLFWPQSENINDRGLSRKHIMESVERSLRHLKTDYLDIYFCHREDPETPLEETIRAMDDLVHQGKILYWGTSLWQPKTLAQVHKLAGSSYYAPTVEQPDYNLLTRYIEKRIIPAAKKYGMGLVVFSPLAGGMLTGKYDDGEPAGSRAATTDFLDKHKNDTQRQQVKKFTALARSRDLLPSALALAWILKEPQITSAITGATRKEHVINNLKATEIKMEESLYREITQIFS